MLEDITIIELATGVAGPFATKLLADWGAHVVKVEPPGGDPVRRMGPFPDDLPHPERSAWFHYLNTGKKGATIDISTASGKGLLRQLLGDADVLVEDFPSHRAGALGLDYETLGVEYPRLIVASVTPFGRTGPYQNLKGDEIVYQAMGGFMFLNGRSELPPIMVPWEQAQLLAGRALAVSIMAAVFFQREYSEGQHIDLSVYEAMAAEPPFHLLWYGYTGAIENRGRGFHRWVVDGDVRECSDGWIVLTADGGNPWEMFAVFFDEPALIDDRFASRDARVAHWKELESLIAPKLKGRSRHELFLDGIKERFVFGPVQTLQEILDCPHLESRGAYRRIEGPMGEVLRHPGPGFHVLGSSPSEIPAPMLGQHNEEIFCGQLGYSRGDLVRLRAAGVL